MEGLLQIVILICLLIIIVLLAIDKVQIVKSEKAPEPKPMSSKLPDIMGKTNKDRGNHRLLEGNVERRMMMNNKIYKTGQPKENMSHFMNPILV